MDNVIPFPKKPDSFSKIAVWISEVCRQAGLTEEMIKNVVDQYQEYYSQLFIKYEAKMELPSGLGFNQEQTEAITKAHTDTVQGIFQHHAKQIAHASHIIIGLLAREQLNDAN